MRKILLLMFIFSIHMSISAQTPIINIDNQFGERITNAYYKDIDNLLNPFEGTYIYSNGNTSLKIILVKKTYQYNGFYYSDLIIGEYQYIENGIEKVNTLNEINVNYSNQRMHKIDGNLIINNNNKPICNDCELDEIRLSLNITDPVSERARGLIVRKIITNTNQEAISINFFGSTQTNTSNGDFAIPTGSYTLIKQ